jgi:hypothetical protein
MRGLDAVHLLALLVLASSRSTTRTGACTTPGQTITDEADDGDTVVVRQPGAARFVLHGRAGEVVDAGMAEDQLCSAFTHGPRR